MAAWPSAIEPRLNAGDCAFPRVSPAGVALASAGERRISRAESLAGWLRLAAWSVDGIRPESAWASPGGGIVTSIVADRPALSAYFVHPPYPFQG